MARLKVCILGGTGFVGRAIATRLARRRHDVCVITRHRERHRDMLVLPGLELIGADVHDLGLLRTRFQGLDAVINLVGILNERGRSGKGFERVHVELAAKVVEACRQAKVGRLLHMSALNADPQGPSHYLRTKGRAEALVHKAGGGAPRVTSFRPSVIFGPRDGFFNRFAALLRRIPFVFPLACPDARFQPVYVEDVAEAFVQALENRHTYGKRYDLCGPRVYTLYELVAYTARVLGLKRRIIALSDWQSALQAALLEWAPGKPFSRDNFNSMKVDSVCSKGFPELFGIRPKSVEEIVPGYLGAPSDPTAAYRRSARRG